MGVQVPPFAFFPRRGFALKVKYEVTEGERWKRALKIEVSAEVVQEKFDEIYRQLQTEAKLSGFRPGKAPLKMIKSRFSDVAFKEVRDGLLEESLKEALSESNLNPVNYPAFKDSQFAEGEPFIYTVEFDVKPEITLEKWNGFILKQLDDKVSELEVNDLFEYVQRQNSELVVVERPAQEEDILFVDLDVISASGNKLEEKEFKEVQIELRQGDLTRQFLKELAGKSTDDESEFEIIYPANHLDERFAGSTVRHHARINAVKELHLPELKEDFFQQFGKDVKSVADLKEVLKDSIQGRKKKEAGEMLREEAVKAVVDANRFDLPDSMLENLLDNIVEDYRKQSKEEFDETELRDRYRAMAIRQLRWQLLRHEIASRENITVEQQDIDSWLQGFADNYKMTLEQAKEQISSSRQVADLKERILESKVIDYIIANSTTETITLPTVPPDTD